MGRWCLQPACGRCGANSRKEDRTEAGATCTLVAAARFMLSVFVVARITGILEVEAFAMYGALISGAYMLFGSAVYPRNLVSAVSTWPLPCRRRIRSSPQSLSRSRSPFRNRPCRCSICSAIRSRVPASRSRSASIELLVAAACAGLNSIMTLAALCLFYVYLRHRSNPIAFLVIALAAIPVAIISNFVRVLVSC